MNRIVLFAVCVFLMGIVKGQDIQISTNELSLSKDVVDGRFSFYAVNIVTGEPVVEKNKNLRMIPASTMKLLTAYAALDILGVDHQFETSMLYTGTLDDKGILHGDVIIRGGGDPVLGSDRFYKHYESSATLVEQMAAALKMAGINQVDGRIIGDGLYYQGEPLPTDWVWEDIGNYFGAGAHGLTYRENKYNLYLNSKSTVGEEVEMDESTELLPFLNYEVKARAAKISSDQVYVYSPPYADYAIVRGEMPLNKTKFKVKAAMTDPALVLAMELKALLQGQKIQVSGNSTTLRILRLQEQEVVQAGKTIWTIKSPRLIEIVNYMNIKSNNLIAEHLVKQISVKLGKENGDSAEGLEMISNWLISKGIYDKRIRLKDGSGLSHTNLVTTDWFVRLLKAMNNEPWIDELKEALPTAGHTGSMRRIGKGSVIDNKMKAKTGYIAGVRSYVGFVPNAKGETIVFAIIANDYACSASAMRKKMEKLMIALYNE